MAPEVPAAIVEIVARVVIGLREIVVPAPHAVIGPRESVVLVHREVIGPRESVHKAIGPRESAVLAHLDRWVSARRVHLVARDQPRVQRSRVPR